MTIHNLSEKLGNYFSQKIGQPEKAPILTYGLELIISESSKLMILLLLAYVCGLLLPMLLLLSTYIPLRLLTGGQHCSSSFRCLVSTLLFFPVLAFLASILPSFLEKIYLLAFAFGTSVLFVFILEKYGPGYSINYPDRSVHIIEKMKKYSFYFLIIWLTNILVLTHFIYNTSLYEIISASTAIGILWQGFLITPTGELLIKGVDSGLKSIKIGGD